MPSSPKVIQLRQMLSEKIPGLRLATEHSPDKAIAVWPTGLPQIDQLLGGGLGKGGLTEIVCQGKSSGGALLLSALFGQAREDHQIVTLIDGQNSFHPGSLDQEVLSRLLWVRCRDAAQA